MHGINFQVFKNLNQETTMLQDMMLHPQEPQQLFNVQIMLNSYIYLFLQKYIDRIQVFIVMGF